MEWGRFNPLQTGCAYSPHILGNMALGKTGSKDRLVLEMIIPLEDDILENLIDTFHLRMKNIFPDGDRDVWTNVVSNLIAK